MIALDSIKKSFWALTVSETLEVLETNSKGLSQAEAERRQASFGLNVIPGKKRTTKLVLFLDQLKSPLIFLLLIASGITILVKDYKDAAVIFAAAFLNSLLGFYQENKAENALAHLKTYIKERVRIIREGAEYEIDTTELVPGDVIHLSQGDRIPADVRLLYLNNLLIDESILTGESLPVQKTTHPAGAVAVLGDQKSMAFSGTLVVQGFADAVVCATGPETELGHIAAMVQDHHENEETPLQKAIIAFSVRASFILLAFTFVVFIIGISTGYSLLHMFLTSVAIIVAAIPEGLPVAMTVILAIGVQRLAKKNGIIRKLIAAETLGSTTVILTDKTGTLTEAKMFLHHTETFLEPSVYNEAFLINIALLNSDVIIENPKDPVAQWHVIGRPLEVAIIRSAGALGLHPEKLKKENPVLEFLPFNSAAKYSASIVQIGNRKLLTAFGAPEILLKRSHRTTDGEHQRILKTINDLAAQGSRVLGIAIRDISGDATAALSSHDALPNLFFTGILAFKDPVRVGVRDAIQRISQAGIKTVIVTGDHQGTAVSIAKELGLSHEEINCINGPDLDLMSEEALLKRLPNLSVVSRVSPEGKVKIAKAYRILGDTVAMTGDGINDAPSLKQADIGIAMGSGTDVAKDVAELVLLDDNYETIVAAIEEGRRTMANIRKVIVYLLSSVTDELILIGGSLLAGIALPLTAIQILWVNLFTDSLPAISLAFENGIDHLSERPLRLSQGLLDRPMRFLVFTIGVPTSIMLFGLYFALLRYGFDPLLVQTFIFATFSTYTLFLVFAIRSLQKSIFSYNPFANAYLTAGSAAGILLTIGALYVPPLQTLLGTVPLPLPWLLSVFGVGMINIMAIEFGKFVIRKKLM